MRILLVHNQYRSATPSGENRVVEQEGEALAAAGHEVMRFGRSSDEIEHWSAAKKASLPARVIWSREAHRDLAAALRESRPDVVHVHNTFPLLSAAVLYACRAAAVPVVATFHNYRLACPTGEFFRDGAVCHDCAGRLPLPAVRHGCYRGSRAATAPVALAAGLHRNAWRSMVSAYVFISAAQRDLLGGLGLPAERVFVRHNMMPRSCDEDAPAASPEPMVLYAGRLDEVKGMRQLMAAWDRYRGMSREPGLRLVIAGAGPLEREVAAWASTRPSVEMTGLVPRSRVLELRSRARAVLVPSAWEEPFGLVVVEAMAGGVPPIAAAHGSFVELIADGTDGVLFRPGDPSALALAIADVETNPDRYQIYGKQAREAYEQRFNPEHSLKHLLEIYGFAIAHRA
jgi:glycosyltransferase involved in cell wall biosynthesis